MKSPEIIAMPPSAATELHDSALDAAHMIDDLLESEASVERAVAAASGMVKLFPAEIREPFDDFRQYGNVKGTLVLRGLMPPKELQTATPDVHGNLPKTQPAKAAGLLALSASMLTGSPMAYTSNPRGHLPTFITQVSPLQHDAPKGALRTGEAIGWHAEAGGAPEEYTLEFLSLYCARGQKGVYTKIIPGDVVDRAFSAHERLVLREHRYILAEAILPGSERRKRPILRDTPRGAAVSYADFYSDEAATKEDEYTAAALVAVRDKITEIEDQMTIHELQTGDVLALDNHGLHSRDQFMPAQHPRWQMRIFVGKPGVPLFVDPSF